MNNNYKLYKYVLNNYKYSNKFISIDYFQIDKS